MVIMIVFVLRKNYLDTMLFFVQNSAVGFGDLWKDFVMSADVQFFVFDDKEEIRDLVKNAVGNDSSIYDALVANDSSNIVDFCNVGSVSYIGDEVPAALRMIDGFMDSERFYVITDSLISRIMVAMNLPDRTMYRTWNKMSSSRHNVKKVLMRNKGKLVVSFVV